MLLRNRIQPEKCSPVRKAYTDLGEFCGEIRAMEAIGRGVILFYSGYRVRTSLIVLLLQVIGSLGCSLAALFA